MSSRLVYEGGQSHSSRLIKAFEDLDNLQDYSIKPNGIWDSKAIIKCNGVTINSDDLDIVFSVPFDDDLEPNEAEISIYNLSDTTINRFEKDKQISIEAGYGADTGVIFSGYVREKKTTYEDVDKILKIYAIDDTQERRVDNLTFSEGTNASTILKSLLEKTGLPIDVFSPRRDWTYTSSVTVDGNLMENIKKYAEVCGITAYMNKGKINARYIKDGDNINFTVNEDTGLIGSPEAIEEEVAAEDYVDTMSGYKVKMLLQHRITTAAIVTLNSRAANGVFRVRKGTHSYNVGEATTEFEAVGEITTKIVEKDKEGGTTTASSGGNASGNKVLSAGKKYIGTPYAYGGNSASGMDCSHFVQRAFNDSGTSNIISRGEVSGGSANLSTNIYNSSQKISESQLQAGDIIYFDNGQYKHIGIYSGNGKMLHCYSGGGVKETPISYGGNVVGYGRLW